jgi:hypothetical protein
LVTFSFDPLSIFHRNWKIKRNFCGSFV